MRAGTITAAPLVLRRDGVTWFEIGSDGLEISAAGDAVAFTHRSKATIRGFLAGQQTGFGLPAGELASVARSASEFLRAVGQDR